uniref:Uncharacterized protein n=1 Tax=Caenorhabditis japonica TaxID=281687 RepID=A0A8R1DRY9_CAEJA
MDDVANALAMSQTVMEKMQKLEISKKYDLEKFETILRLPAREVNAFMEKEARKTEEEKMTDDDRRAKKYREEKKDRAARTLQKYFRKIKVRGEKDAYKARITKISPKRRLVLLERIRQEMGEKRPLRRIGGYQVVRAVELHRTRQEARGDWLAKLSVDVNFHDMNLSRPNSPTHAIARAIPTLIRKKAEVKHKEAMKKIDNAMLDLFCGLQTDSI